MNCPVCGADNREGAHFCRRCGSEMSAPDQSLASPVSDEQRMDGTSQEPVLDEVEEPVTEPVPSHQAAEPEPGPVEEASAEPEAEGMGPEAGAEPSPASGIPGTEIVGADEESSAPEGSTEAEQDLPPSDAAVGSGGTGGLAGEPDELPEIEDEPLTFWREEPEPLTAASPGTVLADRYLVVEVLDTDEDSVLYQARDLGQCWHCGLEGDLREESFCPRCGASLDRRPDVRLLQSREAEVELAEGQKVSRRVSYDGLNLLVLAAAETEEEVEAAEPAGIRLLIGQRSDPGIVRELDEDSLLAMILAPTYQSHTSPVVGLFAVADGMGGHESGEVASKMALQVLADRMMREVLLPELAGELALEEDILARLRQATMAANDAVYLARQKRGNDMGTTLTTVLIRNDRLFLAHVGDCRAYRWNAQGLEQLTTDHSVVASMVAKGEAAPEEVYTHPHRSVIYRSIGDQPSVEVDGDVLPLAPGDRLILCCDGLWEMVRDEGIEDVMLQESNPQAACDLLVKHANLAGGEDNISVIVVQVEAV